MCKLILNDNNNAKQYQMPYLLQNHGCRKVHNSEYSLEKFNFKSPVCEILGHSKRDQTGFAKITIYPMYIQ